MTPSNHPSAPAGRYSRYSGAYSRAGRVAKRSRVPHDAADDAATSPQRAAATPGRATAARVIPDHAAATRAMPEHAAATGVIPDRASATRAMPLASALALHRARAPRRIFSARRHSAASQRSAFVGALRIGAAFLLATAMIAFGVSALSAVTESAAPGAAGGSTADAPASTPKSQWARGSVPTLYQIDPAWANAAYAGGTVALNGCGPTCLSMVYVALTGKTDLDPAAMARYSEEGGYVEGDMTSWSLMTEGAAGIGLASAELPADEDAVRAALSQGRPVICSVMPGDFTTTGHFIVLAGENADGSVAVHDPNSAERTAQSWDLTRILGQCRNLWAFSAA